MGEKECACENMIKKKKRVDEKKKGKFCECVVGQVRQKMERKNVCMCGRIGRA
jgi:hypothetical protein